MQPGFQISPIFESALVESALVDIAARDSDCANQPGHHCTMTRVTARWICGWLSLAGIFWNPLAAQEAASSLSTDKLFRSQVVPILVQKCLTCHGGKNTEGGYSLADLDSMSRPGDSGELPLVFGHPEQSEFWRRVTSTEDDVRMPVDGPALSTAEIEAVRQWLRTGKPIAESFNTQERAQQLASWLEMNQQIAIPEHYPRALPVNALASTQDGAHLVVAGYGEVTVWETATGLLQRRIPVGGRHISQLQLSVDETQMLVSSGTPGEQGLVELIPFASTATHSAQPTPQRILALPDIPMAVCLSPDSRQIAIGGMDGVLRIATLGSSQMEITELASHADAILDIAWSGDGSRLLTASRDRTAKLFNTSTWELLISYARHERAVGGAGFVGKYPTTLDETGTLRLMEGDNLENDRAIAEKSGLPRRLQSFRVHGAKVIVADGGQLRQLEVAQEVVSDGESSDGKPKTKKVVRWVEVPTEPLACVGTIQSLAVGGEAWLVIGTDRGEVARWQPEMHQAPRWLVATP